MRRAGGLAVSVLVFYSDNQSSNPVEAYYSFILKNENLVQIGLSQSNSPTYLYGEGCYFF